MDKFSDITAAGLVEGLGKELEPCPGQSQGPMLVQPASGQWIFQYNHAEPTKVVILVNVVFGPPFSSIVELRSEMHESQIKTLTDWLARILRTMHEEPDNF